MRSLDSLRVAFVSDTINGRLGGGVVAARHVVGALREEGHAVRVVAADATDAADVTLRGFRLPLRAMREMQFTMAAPERAALAHAFRDVDVVHVHFPFWLGSVAVEVARRANKPVIAAFHVQPENALLNVNVCSPRLCRLVYRIWMARAFNRVDAVVCPSAFAERKLRAHGLSTPAFVVSNGVPPDAAGSGAASREPQFGAHFLVLAVGRLAAEKRQDVIIEAVRRSRHRNRIRLVLAGAGPKERELRARGATLPYPPEIGFVSRERLLRLLSTADLFVHASEVELEGIAVLEAMSKGLPVLLAQSPESAASELALSDDFRFPAGDAGALAAKIDALIEHPDRLAAAAPRYRAAACAFDFRRSLSALVAIYRGVLDASRSVLRESETARRLPSGRMVARVAAS
jgi:glycosyltransferase involved in cell wall biosynthesis